MPIPAITSRIEGATFNLFAATATAASSPSINSSVWIVSVI
jgi:hypothetical protein